MKVTTAAPASPLCRSILGMRVHATSYDDASSRVMAWAEGEDRRRYVCVTTVHTVMEAHDDVLLKSIVNNADLVTPDGMPLVWGLRLLGARDAARVYGPVLTPRVLAEAARAGVRSDSTAARRTSSTSWSRSLASGFRAPHRVRVVAAVPADQPGRGHGHRRGHQPVGSAHPVRRPRLSEAGSLDGGPSLAGERRHAGRGRGLRLPGWQQGSSAALDAGPGSGMGLPPGLGATAALVALSVAQPAVRRAVRPAAIEHRWLSFSREETL